ncbi:MAG: hypothetical protein IT385_25615 [Deltaproteobacteria bacterium]|nr:hypothetical protein [Deltaproteobacteria bacterium]
MSLFVLVSLAACDDGGGGGTTTTTTEQDGDTSTSSGGACLISWNSQDWEYDCPDGVPCGADLAQCTPVGRTRGTAQVGEPCVSDRMLYELGDDCAPDTTWPGDHPKGTQCIAVSIVNRVCSHGCESGTDCDDMSGDWGCDVFGWQVCKPNF